MSTITQIKVEGLRQLTAAGHLEKELEAVPGVRSVEIDHGSERVIVEHDNAETAKLLAALADEGFRGEVVGQGGPPAR